MDFSWVLAAEELNLGQGWFPAFRPTRAGGRGVASLGRPMGRGRDGDGAPDAVDTGPAWQWHRVATASRGRQRVEPVEPGWTGSHWSVRLAGGSHRRWRFRRRGHHYELEVIGANLVTRLVG